MKSSFLLAMILGVLVTTHASAQTKQNKKTTTKPATKAITKPTTKTTTTSAPVATQTVETEKSSFDKFYERLGISYYGAITSPTLEDWNSEYASLSPEFSSGDPCKNCDTYAFNIWNQLNFSYNFGARMKFNVIPRWTNFFSTPDTQAKAERGFFMLEDALVGFSGVILSSDDKKFNWWMRPGIRLPTSHFSRHYNHPDFGRISYNVEVTNSFTYDFTPTYQLGLSYQNRYWIFENNYNWSRNRHYIAPNFTITLNDTTKVIGYYEVMFENNKRWESVNGKKPVFYDMWQNAYIGIGKDITPKLNVYPYISAFVNDVPFSTKSFWTGLWVSYTIK